MHNIYLMTLYTLREALARKVFIAFFIMSSLAILVTFLVFILGDFIPELGEGENMEELVIGIQIGIIYMVNSLGLLLSIFSTASFMPQIMERGTVDLFLSRPLSRTQILLGRYIGGLLVVLINIAYSVLGIWLIISLKFGYWNFYFLLTIVSITFVFASLYSLMTLLGVATKSNVPGMMAAYFIFLILSPLLAVREGLYELVGSKALEIFVDTIYYIIPKTSELFGEFSQQMVMGKKFIDGQPILTTFAFTIIVLFGAIWMFKKKDF